MLDGNGDSRQPELAGGPFGLVLLDGLLPVDYQVLELGRRLVDRGAITAVTDVFMLTRPDRIGPYESADRVWSEHLWPLYILLLLAVDFDSSRYAFNDAHRSTPIELGWSWMFKGLADDDRAFIGRRDRTRPRTWLSFAWSASAAAG